MLRRKPARFRFGEPSFGRRIPRCNFNIIKADVEAVKKISILDLDKEHKEVTQLFKNKNIDQSDKRLDSEESKRTFSIEENRPS
ncbi:MAG: hypothetical protein SGJ02_07720 [bacterium]|nr:hypothetical protein [bacterium]